MWMRLILVLAALSVSGCSYFKGKQRLDLAPFAERTVALAADIEYGSLQSGSAHYLRDYREDPVVVANKENWNHIRTLVRGIVAYSIEISTLGASNLAELERNEHFAKFLDRLLREPLLDPPSAVRFTVADLDTMLADIREQTVFLDALKSAQPFIDELARLADLLFDKAQDDLDFVADHLHERIGEENAGPVATWDALREAQTRIFESLGMVRQLRFERDPEILERLYANEPEYRDFSADPMQPTQKELTEIAMDMVQRLQFGVDLKELIAPDLERFQNQQLELDRLYRAAMLQLKKARVTVIIWARAHRNLSEGVTDPAKIDIFDVTKKAVDTVL